MKPPVRLAISTCPNDTFAFHGILERRIDFRGLEFEIELLDIEQLNSRLALSAFDICKVSFVAALAHAARATVLPVGAALGFGVGPVVLGREANSLADWTERAAALGPVLIACPGKWTTATFLCQALLPFPVAPQQMLFSEIMPAVQAGRMPLGVCIHEGRFTWQAAGLHCLVDLGALWEQRTEMPLPLGGLVARRDLPETVQRTATAVIRDSLEYAHEHRAETLATMRRYAQEFSDAVLFQHVDLYVNDWTRELGETGRTALRTLQNLARQVQPTWCQELRVWGEVPYM